MKEEAIAIAIIMIITTIAFIYSVLNDALSTYSIHNNLKPIFCMYIHTQNRQS